MGIAAKSVDVNIFRVETSSIEVTDASSVDYTNNWVRDLSDGDDFVVSFWVRPGSTTNKTFTVISIATSDSNLRARISIDINASAQGKLIIEHDANPGSGQGLKAETAFGDLPLNNWNHVIYSWDDSTSTFKLAINDSTVTPTITGSGVKMFEPSGSHSYDKDDTRLGYKEKDGSGATDHLFGCIAEFWTKDVYYDVSQTVNRRKFISATGKPVTLPASPLVYLHGSTSTWSNTGSTDLGTQTLSNIFSCIDEASD